MSARHRRWGRLAAPPILSGLLLGACAGPSDHFYALTTLPDAPRAPTGKFVTPVVLKVSIPDVVDRRQMVIATATDRILILEHERWPGPLSELVTQTVASDLERRRPDVLVAGRGFDPPDPGTVRIQIEVVRLSAHRDGEATLEAHWRIVDPTTRSDQFGGGTFSAPPYGRVEGDDYSPIARALSTCIASLADRLAQTLPAR